MLSNAKHFLRRKFTNESIIRGTLIRNVFNMLFKHIEYLISHQSLSKWNIGTQWEILKYIRGNVTN